MTVPPASGGRIIVVPPEVVLQGGGREHSGARLQLLRPPCAPVAGIPHVEFRGSTGVDRAGGHVGALRATRVHREPLFSWDAREEHDGPRVPSRPDTRQLPVLRDGSGAADGFEERSRVGAADLERVDDRRPRIVRVGAEDDVGGLRVAVAAAGVCDAW